MAVIFVSPSCLRGSASEVAALSIMMSMPPVVTGTARLRGDDSLKFGANELRSPPRSTTPARLRMLLGDHLGGAVLGVAQAALAGEALLLAGNVVGHARERRAVNTGLPVARSVSV